MSGLEFQEWYYNTHNRFATIHDVDISVFKEYLDYKSKKENKAVWKIIRDEYVYKKWGIIDK